MCKIKFAVLPIWLLQPPLTKLRWGTKMTKEKQEHTINIRQDSSTLNILGSAVSNFIRISDGCIMPSISIEETKELA